MGNAMITYFDMGVAGFVLLSALIGFAVGFVKGGLFLMSWMGAVLVTLYTYAVARPFARDMVENELIADLGSVAAIFIVTLILLYLLSSLVGGWVRRSRLNALDRSLGFLGGILVSAVVLSAAYIPLSYMWPPDEQPRWIKAAKSRPWVAAGAGIILKLAPDGLIDESNATARQMRSEVNEAAGRTAYELLKPPRAGAGAGRSGGDNGYSVDIRKGLEKAIEANR
jgi:membrane protein required for colicin V production